MPNIIEFQKLSFIQCFKTHALKAIVDRRKASSSAIQLKVFNNSSNILWRDVQRSPFSHIETKSMRLVFNATNCSTSRKFEEKIKKSFLLTFAIQLRGQLQNTYILSPNIFNRLQKIREVLFLIVTYFCIYITGKDILFIVVITQLWSRKKIKTILHHP